MSPSWLVPCYEVAEITSDHAAIPGVLFAMPRGKLQSYPAHPHPTTKEKRKELRVVMRNKPAECCVPGFALPKDPLNMPRILPLVPGGRDSYKVNEQQPSLTDGDVMLSISPRWACRYQEIVGAGPMLQRESSLNALGWWCCDGGLLMVVVPLTLPSNRPVHRDPGDYSCGGQCYRGFSPFPVVDSLWLWLPCLSFLPTACPLMSRSSLILPDSELSCPHSRQRQDDARA